MQEDSDSARSAGEVEVRAPTGDVQAVSWKGWLVPMGDGPYPRRVWEPWTARMEAGPGITLGTNDHTEPFCRISGYLRNAEANARRLCAMWNAFLGVPTEEIERIAKARSGWVPPAADEMWNYPDAPPMKRATARNPNEKTPPTQ